MGIDFKDKIIAVIGAGIAAGPLVEAAARYAIAMEKVERACIILREQGMTVAIASPYDFVEHRLSDSLMDELAAIKVQIADGFFEEDYQDWRGLEHCVKGRILKPYTRAVKRQPIRFKRGIKHPPL